MESTSTSNLFYSPPALTQHVDYQSKAEKRKAELEALRQQSITKQKASQLKTAEAPKEFADFDQKQRSFLTEQRHRQRHAKEMLHQYRADEQMVLSGATPRRRPMSDASTANRLSRSPDAFASVYHSPEYSVVPFPDTASLDPSGGYGDDDSSTNENMMYYPAACTDNLPEVEDSVQYYDDQASYYQAQEQHGASDLATSFTPTNAQRPPSLDPTESGTTGATSAQSTAYNSPFMTSMGPRQGLNPSDDDISPLFVRDAAWSSPMATSSPALHIMSHVDPTQSDPSSEQLEGNIPLDSMPSPTTLIMTVTDGTTTGMVEEEVMPPTTTTANDDIVPFGGDPMSSFESCQQDPIGLEELEAPTLTTQVHGDNEVIAPTTSHVPIVPTVKSPSATSDWLSESCTTPKNDDSNEPVTDCETSDAAVVHSPMVPATPLAAANDITTKLSAIELASPGDQLPVTNDVNTIISSEACETLNASIEDEQVHMSTPLAQESPTKEPKQCELKDLRNDSSLRDTTLVESAGSNENPLHSLETHTHKSAASMEHSIDNNDGNKVPLALTTSLVEDEEDAQNEEIKDSVRADILQSSTLTLEPQVEDTTFPTAIPEMAVKDDLPLCDTQRKEEDSQSIQLESSEPILLSSDAETANSSVCTKETAIATATAVQEVSICSGRSSRTTRTKIQTKTPSGWSSMFARYMGNQRYTR
eukprot:Nitzschia sp. Nitz4//scaffold18_size181773//57941//60153//NITZ4_001910-RA/size181773-snap-gene-0.273-mRNA-1//-1//CDS//3329539996//5098//frame0